MNLTKLDEEWYKVEDIGYIRKVFHTKEDGGNNTWIFVGWKHFEAPRKYFSTLERCLEALNNGKA